MPSKIVSATVALLLMPAAQAVAAPAPAAAPAIVHGPPIPGMCIFSDARALANSAAGQAANARLQQLKEPLSSAYTTENNALDAEIKAFQARRPTLTPDQIKAQAGPLQERKNALELKAAQQGRQLEITAQTAKQRIQAQIQPIAVSIYQARHCSMLVAGDVTPFFNQAMDITPAVIKQLNASMPTISFDLAPLPANQ